MAQANEVFFFINVCLSNQKIMLNGKNVLYLIRLQSFGSVNVSKFIRNVENGRFVNFSLL